MDINIFTPETLLHQAQITPLQQGYHHVYFYVDEQGHIAKHVTDTLGLFYFSPSGGTLRDHELNIVLYSARFDKFKGIGKAE